MTQAVDEDFDDSAVWWIGAVERKTADVVDLEKVKAKTNAVVENCTSEHIRGA